MRRWPAPADLLAVVDALPDHALVEHRKAGTWAGWYAWVSLNLRAMSDPDFSTGAQTREDAVRLCAAKIREDLRCIGKYAPHWGHYDLRYRIVPHWQRRVMFEAV